MDLSLAAYLLLSHLFVMLEYREPIATLDVSL